MENSEFEILKIENIKLQSNLDSAIAAIHHLREVMKRASDETDGTMVHDDVLHALAATSGYEEKE